MCSIKQIATASNGALKPPKRLINPPKKFIPSKIIPSKRTKNVTYAVRDIVVLAQKTKESGKKMMWLNIGDPLKYDFETPKHKIEAVTKA